MYILVLTPYQVRLPCSTNFQVFFIKFIHFSTGHDTLLYTAEYTGSLFMYQAIILCILMFFSWVAVIYITSENLITA